MARRHSGNRREAESSRQHRRDRKPAMADDLSGDPLPHFAFGLRIDWQYKVGMGLDVDEARRHGEALGIDYLVCGVREGRTDRCNATSSKSDIAHGARVAATVNNVSAAD